MGTLQHIALAGLVAAEGAGHEAGGQPGILEQLGISFPLILIQAMGFLLLLWLLLKFLYRPILEMLEGRESEIRTRYSDADQARGTAEELRRDYESRLANIETEARDRVQDGIREGQAMRAQLLAQAQEERERIIQQGHREVSEEREKMVYSVRESVVNMTVDAAGRIISRSMDDTTQRALVEEFLAEIPARSGSEARG